MELKFATAGKERNHSVPSLFYETHSGDEESEEETQEGIFQSWVG